MLCDVAGERGNGELSPSRAGTGACDPEEVISKGMFLSAAINVRVLEAQLNAQISQLRDSGQWQGPDAQRYFAEWESEVRGRLLTAASLLDGLVVVAV